MNAYDPDDLFFDIDLQVKLYMLLPIIILVLPTRVKRTNFDFFDY